MRYRLQARPFKVLRPDDVADADLPLVHVFRDDELDELILELIRYFGADGAWVDARTQAIRRILGA